MSVFNPDNIPLEMKEAPRWVLFTMFENMYSKRLEKLPWSTNGKMADITNPDSWSSFDRAFSVLQKNRNYKGLGFVLGSGFFGIDLDHVIDENGVIEPWAEEIINKMDSYTELSPSGTGIHIYARGKLPPKDRKNGKVEMYDEKRYFTVTGNVYGKPKPLAERTKEAAAVHRQYLKRDHREGQIPQVSSVTASRDVDELVKKAESAKNGEKFLSLYKGNTSGYASQSQADQALCNILAFYAGGDRGLIDAAFRSSGLMRPKWDGRRGSMTYGEMTIEKAVASVSVQAPSYVAAEGKVSGNGSKTAPLPVDMMSGSEMPLSGKDTETIPPVEMKEPGVREGQEEKTGEEEKQDKEKREIKSDAKEKAEKPGIKGQKQKDTEKKQETVPVIKHDNAAYAAGSGLFTDIRSDWSRGLIRREMAEKRAATGLEELDRRLGGGIGKGIWLLGSEPSIGKTSLMLHFARKAAADGAEVMYISFEQEASYLEAKIIASELTEQSGMRISPERILGGARAEEVSAMTGEDPLFGRIHFVRGGDCPGEKALLDIIGEFSDMRKPYADAVNKPCVVFIDYLQIIPFSGGSGIRLQIDDFARRLRQLQMQKGISVFLISSLNRMSYMGPVRLDSFKESGIIEFTGDVILGLNLRAVRGDDFLRLTDTAEKAARLEAARARRVRELEITCLKNKTGESSFSVDVNFDTESGIFTAVRPR